MKFRIKANVKPLKRTARKVLDGRVMDILGGVVDDVIVNGTRVWRKIGDVEIFDNTTSKVIYGDATPEIITVLRAALVDCGCKLE